MALELGRRESDNLEFGDFVEGFDECVEPMNDHADRLNDENSEQEEDNADSQRINLQRLGGLLETTRGFIHLGPGEAL